MSYLKFYCLFFRLGFLGYHDIFVIFSFWVYSGIWYKMVAWFHFFGIYQSSSPNIIYWRDCPYSIVCSCLLCQILIDHRLLGLFLGSLFWSIDPCVCSCASARLFWLLWPCCIVQYQVLWSFQFCSFLSRLLRLFRVFFGFIYILGIFVLILWNIPLVS